MIEERLNYLSFPSTENDTENSLLNVHAAKKWTENTVEVCQAAN
jgi:hypothetical protein